jgi:menaquinone-dependent protoporphyrinogen oxidase
VTNQILVAYATSAGSTLEVAEAIAETLCEQGEQAEVQPARNVRWLDGYEAIVLGAPLYMFRWHRDAMRFLSRHRKGLAERPVAIFALGPFHADEKERQDALAQLDKELAKFPWLAPAAQEMFGGKFDPAKLRFPLNLIPALRQMPASDARDWTAIRAWAANLPAVLWAK